MTSRYLLIAYMISSVLVSQFALSWHDVYKVESGVKLKSN